MSWYEGWDDGFIKSGHNQSKELYRLAVIAYQGKI